MSITTLTTKELDQSPSRAKKAAANGPVFIIENGRHAFVLLTIEDYREITGVRENFLGHDRTDKLPDLPE